MKRWLSLLLLLGALLGLVGQEAAFANVLPAQKVEHTATAAPMTPECAEMMGLAAKKPDSSKPCEGMTPECIAKMGCAVPLAVLPPLLFAAAAALPTDLPRLFRMAPMAGRTVRPEPEPPASLG